MCVGYTIFTDSQTDAVAIVRMAKKHRLRACIAGNVVKSNKREVEIKPLNVHLSAEHFFLPKNAKVQDHGSTITSGSGSPFAQ